MRDAHSRDVCRVGVRSPGTLKAFKHTSLLTWGRRTSFQVTLSPTFISFRTGKHFVGTIKTRGDRSSPQRSFYIMK